MRMTLPRLIAAALLAVAVAAGCSGSSSSAGSRPSTTASLTILQPVPNQVTGPDVTLQLQLTGASIVPFTNQKVVANQGHVHVLVDQKLVSMTQGLTQPLTGLTPGPHVLQAEFVATDHIPFKNRVVASVLFTVK
jgi:Family of unknown function (DUF6130)